MKLNEVSDGKDFTLLFGEQMAMRTTGNSQK